MYSKKCILLGLSISVAILASGCGGKRQHTTVESEPCADTLNETYIHKYGVTVPQAEWKDRGQNGKIVSTLTTGVVVTKSYKEGYLDGETTYTFPHSGATEKIEVYSQGQLVKELENYPSGIAKRQVEYPSSKVRQVTTWYENGEPHFREEYNNGKLIEADYYNQSNQIESRVDEGEGKRVNRDEFGLLLSEDKIEQGVLVHRMILFPNGTVKEIIPYSNGKINGRKQTFLPGGEPYSLEEWENDRKHGLTVIFRNGEKIAEVPYLKGVKNGVEERFRDGIFRVEEISWKNGQKHGPCYRHIGEDTVVEWYCEGKLSTKEEYQLVENFQFR